MRHDILSDVLITIKNADLIGKTSAVVPASKLIDPFPNRDITT